MNFTEVFYKQSALLKEKRIIVSFGGSSSSKTISALQLFTLLALNSKKPFIFTLIGESMPVIKRTILRDWKRFVMEDIFNSRNFNKVELTYTFDSGCIFQFVSADDPDRFRGMRQDFTLMDEASNMHQDVFDQVEIRTNKKIILTFNPSHEFWVSDVMARDDCGVIHSTYKDNPYVDENIKKSLESRIKTNPNFYRVYVLGEWGTLEGLIFNNWKIVESIPDDVKKRFGGLDFGYTNDPSTLTDVVFANQCVYLDELIYECGLTNQDLGKKIIDLGYKNEIIADSAEPKSIEEIHRMRIRIGATVKGKDSINSGISTMQSVNLKVTKRSINIIKELRNYRWATDKNGKSINVPIDDFNHAIDGIRYVFLVKANKPSGKIAISTTHGHY